MLLSIRLSVLFILITLINCRNPTDLPDVGMLQLVVARIGTSNLNLQVDAQNLEMPYDRPILLSFSSSLDTTSAHQAISLSIGDTQLNLGFAFLDNERTVSITPSQPLKNNQTYQITISEELKGLQGQKFPGIILKFTTVAGKIQVLTFTIDEQVATDNQVIQNVGLQPVFEILFSAELDSTTLSSQNIYLSGKQIVPIEIILSADNLQLTINTTQELLDLNKYQLTFNNQIRGKNGEVLTSLSKVFFTKSSEELKYPLITDEELLTLVQSQTFRYFWDFAQPASGMARERNSSGNLVTSGGSGFGIMSIIVGIERGFITRQAGIDRLGIILDFLEKADRFHGVWPHWMDGNTGQTIPFSANDNGGDLVETAFLVQGLLTFRQYLNTADQKENQLIARINQLWEAVEWDWYRRDNQEVLYWHWSPDKEWAMNLQISGWNESLIIYVLAASSPTHSIPKSVYDQGWARNGNMRNGKTFEGIELPLGYDYGGPLFFAHYSFLGLDPRNLNDTWCADYFEQNKNHTLINRAYCIRNPREYVVYSTESWGLTASDNQNGYSAHSPTNDRGVITPTAALSSMPYTPEESMEALRFFYYKLGDRLWGEYGFYDAFNITEGWVASSYLAIDQGPIIVMIENYRSGLLWDLFMSAPEVQNGLSELSFNY